MKVFLDLDQTLIYSVPVEEDPDSLLREYCPGYATALRPYAHWFIQELLTCGHSVEIITYADLRYAEQIVRGSGLPVERITSMRALNVPRCLTGREWVLVDDMFCQDKLRLLSHAEVEQEHHWIAIYPFTGDMSDTHLVDTLKLIQWLDFRCGVDAETYYKAEIEYYDILEDRTHPLQHRLKVYEGHASLWGAIAEIESHSA